MDAPGATNPGPTHQSDSEDQIILRELCTINGVSYDKLEKGSGTKVQKLEIFFFGCPYIPSGCMAFFPNLTELRIVNQKFTRVSGLEACVNLTSLWICEAQVECIEGLSQCTNLTSLFLYTNNISTIEGLGALTKLEKLWLNANAISAIEGIDDLINLKELNLAQNLIPSIGRTLDHLTQLEELNLSGNRLSSLRDIVHLSTLPRLRTLSLCDPLYPPNPICSLCNYSTHILYHLPSLQWLDGIDVNSDDLRQLVQDVVERKKRFYRMKVHHIQMEARQNETEVTEQVETPKRETHCKIREAQKQLKTLEYYGGCVEEADSKRSLLTNITKTLNSHLNRLNHQATARCMNITTRSHELCQRWTTELESGGNIRFIEGTPSVPWFKSCVDLVNSRFSVGEVQTQGISGVEVTGVVKVENRLQYTRFNQALKVELQKEVYQSLASGRSYKQLLDYFFIVWNPGMTLIDLCRDTQQTTHPCHMANSVNVADRLRLSEMKKDQSSDEQSLCQDFSSQLVLFKVFVGITSETKSAKMPSVSRHPGVNCVRRVSTGGDEWFIMNRDLLLPEYIIHYNYVSSNADKNHMMSCDLPVTMPKPASPAHPRLAMLDEHTVLQVTRKETLVAVKELCLHDNHLRRFRLGPNLPSLVKLILSFNELSSAEDIHNMPNLEYMDLSFNKFTDLDGLKALPKLKHLDISCNELSCFYDVVTILRKHTPSLEVLGTRYNPWTRFSYLRPYVIGRLKTLKCLDGCPVTEDETASALRGVVSSHLSLTSLMSHAHTHTHTPRLLTLGPVAQALHMDPHSRPTHISPQVNWTQMVTSVCVCGLGIQKLSCLDHMTNLRWLCLADNALTSIEGLSLCSKLEELTLDNNLLESLPSLHTFPALRWLSLSGNNLAKLPSLQVQLEYLNISHNAITSLEQLKQCSSLVELYASGNKVPTTRQLFSLKSLLLFVCDLTGNPVTRVSAYRMFMIYHLSSLRALDGAAVETSEVVSAREKMGGRLSQDLVYERHPDVDPMTFRQLDLTHSGIKHIDLSPVSVFDNLASVNLEHNSLTSFSGLIHLNKLKVLCLNHNRIEHLLPPREAMPSSDHVMHSLEVVHLAYNGISNLVPLQLHRVPSLRALFLQGNEISHVDGLRGLEHLTELVLDRNKIKALQETSVLSLVSLRELHIEENRLKDLSHFSPLDNLQRLYLGMNKIQDFTQLEKLSGLVQLIELSVVSNPVSRRLQHRGLLIHHVPSLLSLDGVLISPEERQAADLTFSDPQQDVDVPLDVGLTHGSLLKVMNVPFGQHTHHYRRDPKGAAPSQGLNDRRRGRR